MTVKPSGMLRDIGGFGITPMPQHPLRGIKGQNPSKIKRLAKRFLAYRAARREADESVDAYFRRGEDTPRFAYFD